MTCNFQAVETLVDIIKRMCMYGDARMCMYENARMCMYKMRDGYRKWK